MTGDEERRRPRVPAWLAALFRSASRKVGSERAKRAAVAAALAAATAATALVLGTAFGADPMGLRTDDVSDETPLVEAVEEDVDRLASANARLDEATGRLADDLDALDAALVAGFGDVETRNDAQTRAVATLADAVRRDAEDVDRLAEETAGRLTSLGESLGALDAEVEGLADSTDARLAALGESLDAVAVDLGAVASDLAATSARLDEAAGVASSALAAADEAALSASEALSGVEETVERIAALEQGVSSLSGTVSGLSSDVGALRSDLDGLASRVADLEAHSHPTYDDSALTARLDDLDARLAANALEDAKWRPYTEPDWQPPSGTTVVPVHVPDSGGSYHGLFFLDVTGTECVVRYGFIQPIFATTLPTGKHAVTVPRQSLGQGDHELHVVVETAAPTCAVRNIAAVAWRSTASP